MAAASGPTRAGQDRRGAGLVGGRGGPGGVDGLDHVVVGRADGGAGVQIVQRVQVLRDRRGRLAAGRGAAVDVVAEDGAAGGRGPGQVRQALRRGRRQRADRAGQQGAPAGLVGGGARAGGVHRDDLVVVGRADGGAGIHVGGSRQADRQRRGRLAAGRGAPIEADAGDRAGGGARGVPREGDLAGGAAGRERGRRRGGVGHDGDRARELAHSGVVGRLDGVVVGRAWSGARVAIGEARQAGRERRGRHRVAARAPVEGVALDGRVRRVPGERRLAGVQAGGEGRSAGRGSARR